MSVNINNTGLLYYYPFDTDTLNYASGVGVADGSSSFVSLVNYNTNMPSGSLYFAGVSGQYFKLPTTTFASTGITFSFWMQCVSITSPDSCIFKFESSDGTKNIKLGAIDVNSAFRVFLNNGYLGTGEYLDGFWHHFCLTMIAGSAVFYFDGINTGPRYGMYNPSGIPYSMALTNCVLGSTGSTSPYIVGYMNQFTVFNRVLSSTEISYLYKFPTQLTFTSAATTTTLSAFDSYVLTPSNFLYPPSTATGNLQYFSLNYTSSNVYSLRNANGTVFASRRFAAGSTIIPKNTAYTQLYTAALANCISVDASGNIYCVPKNGPTSYIIVMNPSLQTIATVTATEKYLNFGMDISNNKLYCAGLNTVGILNLTTYALTTFTAPTGGLYSIALGPDGYLYGTSRSASSIKRINPANGTYTTIFTTATINVFYGCDFDSNGYLYCVTGFDLYGYIYKFDTSGNNLGLFATTHTAGTTYNAICLTCDKSNNNLYVSGSTGVGTIYKIVPSGVSLKFSLSFIPSSSFPYYSGIYYDPFTTYLYAADGQGNTLYIYPTRPSNYTLNFKFPSSYIYPGSNLLQLYDKTYVAFGTSIIISVACFLEGTLIKCLSDNMIDDVYIPVEKLTKDTYVKTLSSGYIQIHSIGFAEIYNPSDETEIDNRLFKYKKGDERMPELFQDLYITGNHAALVETFSQEEYGRVVKHMGAVYETEKRFRMPACLDPRAEPFVEPGTYKIWHFALQNPDIYTNYGVYANGLLVESSSIRYLTELSKMELV